MYTTLCTEFRDGAKQQMHSVKWIFVIAAMAAIAATGTSTAQETGWDVPNDFQTLQNPIAATPGVVEAGKQLYDKNCQRCHGVRGLGDGPATKFIKPAPKEIASAATQDRMSDGEIFYKITEGRKPMPPMKSTLTERERWQIVHFVRTLRR